MQNKMYLVLGDWSGNGHGKHEKVLLQSSSDVATIQQAYKNSGKLTGLSFNTNENYTGKKRDYEEAEKYIIAADFEDSRLKPLHIEILAKHGLTEGKLRNFDEEEVIDSDYQFGQEVFLTPILFTNLWIWFVKLSDPFLELSRANKSDDIPNINGFESSKVLNAHFGYGIFQ